MDGYWVGSLFFDSDYWQDIERSKRAVDEIRLYIQSIHEEPLLDWFDKFAS